MASAEVIQAAFEKGPLIVNECVLAEITPAFTPFELNQFIKDWNVQYIPSSQQTALLAGEMFRTYLQRRSEFSRVLPDFLIGAHATLQTDALIARDRGYYRDYFTDLNLIDPTGEK
jgi:hypothetical protein